MQTPHFLGRGRQQKLYQANKRMSFGSIVLKVLDADHPFCNNGIVANSRVSLRFKQLYYFTMCF